MAKSKPVGQTWCWPS